MSGTKISRGGDAGQVVTIAASGTTSTAYDARDGIAYGVFLPAAFTGTSLSFTGCWFKDGAYVVLNDEAGAPITLPTVAPGGYYALPLGLAAVPWFKIVSGSTEGTARELRIVSKN